LYFYSSPATATHRH